MHDGLLSSLHRTIDKVFLLSRISATFLFSTTPLFTYYSTYSLTPHNSFASNVRVNTTDRNVDIPSTPNMRVPSKHQGLHPEAPRTQIIDNGVVLVDIHSKFLQALQTQGRAEYPIFGSLLCPSSGHEGRMFADVHQLLDHLLEKAHEDWEGIKHPKPGRAKKILEEAAHQSR